MTQSFSSESDPLSSSETICQKRQQGDQSSENQLTRTEFLKESLERTARLMALCDKRLGILETDTESLDALTLRDLRSFSKLVIELERDYRDFGQAVEETREPEKLSALEELFASTMFAEGIVPSHFTRKDFIGGISPQVEEYLKKHGHCHLPAQNLNTYPQD